jgi:hypothetical protein
MGKNGQGRSSLLLSSYNFKQGNLLFLINNLRFYL